MTDAMSDVPKVSYLRDDGWLIWYCPGCQRKHSVRTIGPNGWGFNGNTDSPTLSPSVLVHSHKTLIDSSIEDRAALTAPENVTDTPRCHTFIRDGQIEFLGDCTHHLAGQTVDMQPFAVAVTV